MRRLIAVLVLVLPTVAWSQSARETRAVDDTLQVLSNVRAFYQVAVSPDGTRVAWIQNQSREGGRGATVEMAELRSPGKTHTVSAPGGNDAYNEQIAWSADSRRMAFLSNGGKPGQQQLYVADAGSGKVKRVTNLQGSLSSPSWSPDGKSVALLFIEDAPRSAGPLQPMTPPSGVIGQQIFEQRLNLVDLDSGAVRAVSPADMYVYEYDWMPQGDGFVVSAARGQGDNNWWIAQLYRLGMDGRMRAIYQPKLQVANPRVSPDGQQVAFIEGLMSDQGSTGGDVYLLALDNGPTIRSSTSAPAETAKLTPGFGALDLTPGLPASATSLAWAGNDEVRFSEIIDGNSGVASVYTNGTVQQIWSGADFISAGHWDVGVSFSRDAKLSAIVRSSAQRAPEIWAGPPGQWKQITRENDDSKPLWGEWRSVHWTSPASAGLPPQPTPSQLSPEPPVAVAGVDGSDPFRVQGWLLPPLHYDPNQRYPLVVSVHGGPAAACTGGWPGMNAAPLAALGYFVFCPNPRGSYGQGEPFTEANVKDLGGGDLRDILAGVDQVAREFPVDPRRVGIQGWSYGGYMAMWAESQTDRFAAAVAGAGISDWLSYYGENDIDQWMIPYFGASIYDDPAVYAKSQPINFVKRVKTPTLILVGDRDGECPAPQSFEWWHALSSFGTPVEFVVYPNEGHQIQQPQHRRDIILRTVAWFDKYLNPPAKPAAR